MVRLCIALRVFIAALVLLEGTGIARAFGHGGDVSCCCGEHSAARECHCHDCPVVKRRTLHAPDAARLDAARDCDGQVANDTLLVMVALPPAPLGLSSLLDGAALSAQAPTIPPLRLIEAGRPPP